jgi:serine/threonine protein kinase
MVKVGIGSEAGTAAAGSKRPAPAPPSPEAIARHFPQLEIIELLGSGGMGAVYKARQREIDRLVALKILPSEAAGDPGFAERFTREARALAPVYELAWPFLRKLLSFRRLLAHMAMP